MTQKIEESTVEVANGEKKLQTHSRKNSSSTITVSNNIQNFEDVLQSLGGFGVFQFLILVLLLILEVPTAFVTFIPIFVGRVPQLWTCDNETMSVADICGCNGTRLPLETPYESIIAEWDLICEKAWVSDFVTSLQMLGMFFGSVFGSQFADWYGRKYGFLGATLLLSLGSTISALAFDPYTYAVARFLCGTGVTSFMNVTLVGVVEVMPPKWRSLSNCIGPTGEGIMILSILAYFIRPWRTLFWVTIIPFGLIIVIYPNVLESPRWLMKQQRVADAHSVLCYMAKINKKPEVSLEILKKICEKERLQTELAKGEDYRWSYMDFVRDKGLRVTSIYNMAIWFAWSLTYYGISFNIKNVQGDIYLNVFLMGLANALGQRAALLINDRLGRRKSLFASMSFCAISLVSLAICEIVLDPSKVPAMVVTLCLLGQFGMASARSAARLLSGESFPTAVRTMGMGIGGITANIAGILTPQLAYLGSRWPSVPFFAFAAVSVGGSLIAFLMSETMGRPLDESSSEEQLEDDVRKNEEKEGHYNHGFDEKDKMPSIYIIPTPPSNRQEIDLETDNRYNSNLQSVVLVSISKLKDENSTQQLDFEKRS